MTEPIKTLLNAHRGETAYIVAKGPSLEHLTANLLGPGPVIAIHEALAKVESLDIPNRIYALQKDEGTVAPTRAALIVHDHDDPGSKDFMPDYEPRYIFNNPTDFMLPWNAISGITAVALAVYMGCRKIVMVSFDGYTRAENRTWMPDCKGIPQYFPGSGYMRNSVMLYDYLEARNLKPEWVTPAGEIPDTFGHKVLIATPFYEIKGYSPYIKALWRTQNLITSMGIPSGYMAVEGDSYVERAKNMILSLFMETDYSDLLMIDSDMEWDFSDAQAQTNILSSDHELVAGLYPLKNRWDEYGGMIYTDNNGFSLGNAESGLLKASLVPGGFFRIKRTAIQKMFVAYRESFYYERMCDRDMVICNLYECQVKGRRRYGEDYIFCQKWEALGGSIWVEPRINFGHYGVQGWHGNYHEYRLKLAQEEAGRQEDKAA